MVSQLTYLIYRSYFIFKQPWQKGTMWNSEQLQAAGYAEENTAIANGIKIYLTFLWGIYMVLIIYYIRYNLAFRIYQIPLLSITFY